MVKKQDTVIKNPAQKSSGEINLNRKGRAVHQANKGTSVVTDEDPIYYAGKKLSHKISGISAKGKYAAGMFIMLAGIANKPESHMTAIEKMDMVRIGVSKKNLESLKEKTALDYDKLANALSVTRATLINKKGKEKFNASLSERIIGLADIYSYGYGVFEDKARFNKWMFRPNQALAGKAPYELIDNQFGREEVRNIIGRIDYGVYS